MTIATQLTTWPTTQPILCKLLSLDPEAHNLCCGKTQKNLKCKNRIGKAKQACISRLLVKIIVEASFEAVRSFLKQLSSLVVCYLHQDDGKVFLSEWQEKLKGKENSAIKEEEVDPNPALLPIEPQREEIDNTAQSQSFLSVPQIKVEVVDVSNDTSLQDTTNFGSKTTSGRLSTPSFTIPEAPAAAALQATGLKHEFKPSSAEKKTLLEINESVKRLLLRSLSKKEQKICEVKGYLYTYIFPYNYRDPHPYLKIGFSKDPASRMASWERQCGYKPEELSHHVTENYTRVEKLVHAQLENLRLIEFNGCSVCHRKHKEWFDVRSTQASELLSLWCDWMRQKPYDEDGKLKQKWVDELEDADLADSRCWNYFVNGEEKSTLGSDSELTFLGSESEFDSESDSESDSGCESGFLDVTF